MFKFAPAALVFASVMLMAAAPVQTVHAQEAAEAVKPVKQARKLRLRKKSAAPVVIETRERLVRRVITVKGRRRVVYERAATVRAAPPAMSMGDLAGLNLTRDPLDLKSSVAFVLDEASSEVLFEKNANVALPIASITKMMTGLVVVQARQDMDEVLTITEDDVDREKFSSSRLRVGTRMTRGNLLHIALMSSENRAASALGRNYPGGRAAFVDAMNAKARELGMTDTHYVDTNGLSSRNVASARDLAKLAMAAHQEPLLREYSTDPKAVVYAGKTPMQFGNTNYLVSLPDWNIGLQKTGFINEAGRCLMMQAAIAGRNVIMVFLDSKGKLSRTADAGRMRKWLEALRPTVPTAAAVPVTATAAPPLGGS
ncbi:peptidase S11 [Massilia arenosa]|uniref:Peptidase S11 n=1 Tax=Zemynaea arenosa TaxID=2561931 RepID=A0A4Y9RW71_9BURK|nr:serine hydrolase [Massilia arenosa]TFW13212.1 peptidase S11 [Massilia arenosa]